MKNYKLIKRMGAYTLVGTLMLTNPLVVEASDKNYEEKKIEWLNKAKSLGKKAVEYSSKAEDKVFDTMRGIELYDKDKIWLITDIPNVNPDEERNYYFVNGNFPKMKELIVLLKDFILLAPIQINLSKLWKQLIMRIIQ